MYKNEPVQKTNHTITICIYIIRFITRFYLIWFLTNYKHSQYNQMFTLHIDHPLPY
jgi:hypothetical protein